MNKKDNKIKRIGFFYNFIRWMMVILLLAFIDLCIYGFLLEGRWGVERTRFYSFLTASCIISCLFVNEYIRNRKLKTQFVNKIEEAIELKNKKIFSLENDIELAHKKIKELREKI